MNDGYEWVRGSWRNKGYYRKIPFTRYFPTVHQERFQLAAALASRKATNRTGLVEYGGKLVPPMAAEVGEALKGRQFAPAKPPRVPEILERFKPMFEEIGNQVASMKPINSTVIPLLLQWQREEEKRKAALVLKKRLSS